MRSFSSRTRLAAAWLLAISASAFFAGWTATAEAKAPGKRHCHGGVCHRVMTLSETASSIGKLRRISASHYDDCRRDRFNPCGLTSSGEAFRAKAADNTASAIHPDGTILVVRNPANGHAVVVRVNNFGPFKRNRLLDLSRGAAEKLGFARQGVARLDMMVVHAPTPEETRYKRNRRYEPVPGYVGKTASIETAFMQYADLTQKQRIARLEQRIARLDATACAMSQKRRAPRLALLAKRALGIRQRATG